MKIARLGLALALAGAFAGCSPPLPPAQNYATVSGTISDAATNAPIAGASMTINSVLSATADSAGRFTIRNVPNGPWSYVASASNYQQKSDTGPPPLTPGEQRNFPIALNHN